MRWEMGGFFAYETKIQKHNSEGFKGIATHLHSNTTHSGSDQLGARA